MNVSQGPETVFDRPVEQIILDLAGATATDENGRVGNELVFWGYRLADGRAAYLFACAIMKGVDCEARTQEICLGQTNVISTTQTAGDVRHMRCKEFSFVGVGDVRPGCVDRTSDQDLAVGLVQCQ